ncbi:hypothetical protein KC717_06660, partial [Candidatus Dojkabacteria bacterium]|nr:hypothetical protein [Candidatus Dojkabacteria bacterium]
DMVRGIASYYGIHSSDELDIVYELIRATEMNFNLMTGKGLLDEKDGGILESTESELLSIAKKAICLADMGHILFSDKHYYRRRKLLAYEFAKKDFWSEIVLKYAPSSEEDGTSSEEDCTKSKETASEAASGARPDKAIVEFDTNWLKVQGDYIKNQEIRLFPGDVQVNLNYLIWLDKFPEFFDPKSITILKQRLKNRLKNDFLKPCEKDAISIIADGTQFLLQGVKCPVSGQPRDINVNCIPEDFQLYMEAIQSLGFVVVETREP